VTKPPSEWILKQKKVTEYKPFIDWSDDTPCLECGAMLREHSPHWQIILKADNQEKSFDAICDRCFPILNDLILDREE